MWRGQLKPLTGAWRVWCVGKPQVPTWAPCEYLAANNADMGLILFKDICF